MDSVSECPTCRKPVSSAPGAPVMLACPNCLSTFVPTGASSVMLQIQTESGHTKDLGTIALSEAFRARWVLGKLLGRGAMGMVFEARDLTGGPSVAIKFLTQVDDEAVLQRFLREGRLTLGIDHPNVVHVYELAEMQGHPYLVTELMPGGTLRTRMNRQKRLPVEETVRIALDILNGLVAVHAKGVVHRDLKPENILFAEDGSAKITDFGIAKDQTDKEKMTQTGQLLGTPQYISPEQIKNSGITRAADIYSTGVLLYEMLAGRPPFASSDVFNLLMQQVSKTPPHVKDFAPDTPDDIAVLVHRALAKEPAQRPATAEQFASALALCWEQAKLRAAEPPAAVSEGDEPPPPPTRGPLVLALLLFLAMSGGAVATHWMRASRPPIAVSPEPEPSGPMPSGTPVFVGSRLHPVTASASPSASPAPAASASPSASPVSPPPATPAPSRSAPASSVAAPPPARPAPSAPPPPPVADEPRGLEWYIKTRGGTVRQSPVPLPPPPKPDKPELLGFDQSPSFAPSAPNAPPAPSPQPRQQSESNHDEEKLFAHIEGQSQSQSESEAEPKPRSGLGKRAIVAALLLAACGVVAAPQAPWHPQVKALGARGQHALHVWLNPQPVTTAQAPESHESFNRAGDEYKMPVTENIPDATTDPSQIQVTPVVDPTAKKPNNTGANADQPTSQPDGATPTDQPASTPSVQAQPVQGLPAPAQDSKPTQQPTSVPVQPPAAQPQTAPTTAPPVSVPAAVDASRPIPTFAAPPSLAPAMLFQKAISTSARRSRPPPPTASR